MEDLIKDIKNKKELKNLDDEFVKEKLDIYLKNHLLKTNKRSRDYKLMIKTIRKDLREVYGAFIRKKPSLKKLKEALKTKSLKDTLEEHNKILKTHQSTKERLNNYKEVYQTIFKEIKPKIILDLASGLNPLSYPYMNLKNITYIATELTKEDCNFLKEYFNLIKLKHKTFHLNLTKDYKKLKGLKADLTFLLKTLDSLEKVQRNISKEILKVINSRYIVVSFATKSLSGKKSIKERGWFYRILRELNLPFKTFQTSNELFFIIKK